MVSADRSRQTNRARALAIVFAFAALTGGISTCWRFGVADTFTDPMDFRAFYCAGAALARGANPYRVEPVRTCQRGVLAVAGLHLAAPILPAPLPPYALVAFAAFALVPFRYATTLWMAANIAALFAAVVLLAKLSGSRIVYAALALLFSAGVVSLSLGQPIPIVLAAMLFCAYCVRHANGAGAAAGAALAAVEPHLALPVWVALALFFPASRRPLALVATVLVALTLLPGLAVNAEYVRLIPQHARAELPIFENQYGLTALLAFVHVPAEIALRAGTASYAFMLGVGLWLGVALRRRFADPAFLVLAPLATVVVGGPFLHLQQTVVAIPLAFVLLSHLSRATAPFNAVLVAIVLLAIPWPFASAVASGRTETATVITSARDVATIRDAPPDESIEKSYADFVRRFARRATRPDARALVIRKLPTWFGLIVIVLAACRIARGSQRGGVAADDSFARAPLPIA